MSFSAKARPMGFILTRDRARAKLFYSDVLGFRLIFEDGFAAVYDMAGLVVRLTDIADHQPSAHTVLGWQVPDLRAAVDDLTARGVVFIVYPGFGQDAQGIWSSPDGQAQIAWFNDPDGNNLSLTQSG
jgi:catechol 2,3-dioxygenase-like lactoylglutathione lyase family enzyme